MSKSRASKMNGYRSMVSCQKNDIFKFKSKKRERAMQNEWRKLELFIFKRD